MSNIDVVFTLNELLLEMKKNNLLLTIAHSERIIEYLENVATTTDRKKIWVLIDGNRNSQQIADILNLSKRSVDRFFKLAEDQGLLINPWGQPAKKLIEYTPSEWLDLLEEVDIE